MASPKPSTSYLPVGNTDTVSAPPATPRRLGRTAKEQDARFLTFVRRCALGLMLFGVLWIVYGIFSGTAEEPWEWRATASLLCRLHCSLFEHRKPGMDPILKSRPDFRHLERYSPEHRYRPAASPIIRETDRYGRVKVRGQYHP